MVSSCEFFRVIECLRVPVDTSPGPEECLGPVPGVTVLILSSVVRASTVGSSAECKRLGLRLRLRLRPASWAAGGWNGNSRGGDSAEIAHTSLSGFLKSSSACGVLFFSIKAIQQVWSLHYNKYNVNQFCVFNFSNSHFFLFFYSVETRTSFTLGASALPLRCIHSPLSHS